jgi:Putative prokaryotic signal transducing protein
MTGDREGGLGQGGLEAEELVTIAKFLEPVNAQLAKGMLESAGIESFLQGENANSMMAFAFRARLQVQRRDEAAARELLAVFLEDEGGLDTDEL